MERDREVDTYKTVSCLAAMMSLSITNIKPVVSSQLSIRKHDRVCGKTIYEQKRPDQNGRDQLSYSTLYAGETRSNKVAGPMDRSVNLNRI